MSMSRRSASPSSSTSSAPASACAKLWERYQLPIALTEVHHGCTREEQVRWLHDVWNAAKRERARGADIRAVTLWALFGLVDWRSILTRREGIHEPGAFDTRSAEPRLTMIGKAAAKLAAGGELTHPTLKLPGWWKRPGRTYARRRYEMLPSNALEKAQPILITGATGTLGQAFARICAHRGLPFVLTSRADLDITDDASIAAALERFKPWAIINTAGFVRTWEADEKFDECLAINATGPELLGRACKAAGIPLVTFSSDLVFDGQLGRSYVEPDATAPACAYGKSKAEAEQRLMQIDADALIIRTSAFFGPWDRHNFLVDTVEKLRRGEEVFASDKSVVSPTYVPDLVHATLDLLLDDENGIWHLTNQGAISWHELACEIADRAKLDRGKLVRAEDATPRRHQPRQQSRAAAPPARPGARRFPRQRRDAAAADVTLTEQFCRLRAFGCGRRRNGIPSELAGTDVAGPPRAEPGQCRARGRRRGRAP